MRSLQMRVLSKYMNKLFYSPTNPIEEILAYVNVQQTYPSQFFRLRFLFCLFLTLLKLFLGVLKFEVPKIYLSIEITKIIFYRNKLWELNTVKRQIERFNTDQQSWAAEVFDEWKSTELV
jgi:hypothetical protein